jgi:hypothetical protein
MEKVVTNNLDVNATREEALRLLPASEDLKPPTGKLVDLSLNLVSQRHVMARRPRI